MPTVIAPSSSKNTRFRVLGSAERFDTRSASAHGVVAGGRAARHRARGSAARGLERRASCRAASGSGRSAQSAGKEPSTVPAPAPPLRLYFSDWAEVRLPDKHRFPMDKYRATRLALEADMSLRGRVEILRSPEASLEDVLGVHDREYVSRVMRCALTDKEARAIGFPMQNPEQVTRSFASTGEPSPRRATC